MWCSGLLAAYLVVGRTEASAHVLVVENLHLEREVLLEVLDDHHEKRQLDAQSAVLCCRTRNEIR